MSLAAFEAELGTTDVEAAILNFVEIYLWLLFGSTWCDGSLSGNQWAQGVVF